MYTCEPEGSNERAHRRTRSQRNLGQRRSPIILRSILVSGEPHQYHPTTFILYSYSLHIYLLFQCIFYEFSSSSIYQSNWIWKPSFIPFVRSVSMSTHFEKTFKWNSCFNSMLVFLFACLHINSDCMVIICSVINLSVKITLQSFLHSKAYWAASFHKKFTYQSIWFTFLKFFFQSWSPGFLWAPVLSFAFYRGPF